MSGSPGAGGSNPRKFSEKIALHNQKQAEETRAFEQLMTDLTVSRVRCSTHTHMLRFVVFTSRFRTCCCKRVKQKRLVHRSGLVTSLSPDQVVLLCHSPDVLRCDAPVSCTSELTTHLCDVNSDAFD